MYRTPWEALQSAMLSARNKTKEACTHANPSDETLAKAGLGDAPDPWLPGARRSHHMGCEGTSAVTEAFSALLVLMLVHIYM